MNFIKITRPGGFLALFALLLYLGLSVVAGTIKVVHESQLQNPNCTLDAFSLSLSHMGVGVESCPNSEEQEATAK